MRARWADPGEETANDLWASQYGARGHPQGAAAHGSTTPTATTSHVSRTETRATRPEGKAAAQFSPPYDHVCCSDA